MLLIFSHHTHLNMYTYTHLHKRFENKKRVRELDRVEQLLSLFEILDSTSSVKEDRKEKGWVKSGTVSQAIMVHAFNPSTQRQRQEDICKFKVSLVYRIRFITAKDTQRNPKNKNKNSYGLWEDERTDMTNL